MPDQPSPLTRLFETVTGYQRTAIVKAAVELDVFTAVAEGHDTAARLATRCQAAERGARILCDGLVALGLLGKEGGRYVAAPDLGPMLDRRSPVYVASAVDFLASPMIMQGFAELTAAVRKGGTVLGGVALEPDQAMWVTFA